jgi:hypothetical protein
MKDNDIKVCFLIASKLHTKNSEKKGYHALDKNLFIKKPIEEDLLKEANLSAHLLPDKAYF